MAKIDFKRELKHLYRPSVKEVVLVEVPAMNFLMIDGRGDPTSSIEYQNAVQALFGLSYGAKFHLKNGGLGPDYGVMPLEGLWWVPDMLDWQQTPRDEWLWKAMIMQPKLVSPEHVSTVRERLQKEKVMPVLSKVRFESYDEGLSAQIMYIGPYSEEDSTIERIHEFIHNKGYEFRGKHHEIYIGDPRRSAPEKLKTIIRQPVG